MEEEGALPDRIITSNTAKMEQKDLHMSAPKHLKEVFKLYKQASYAAAQDSHSAAGIDDVCKIGIPGKSVVGKARNLIFKDFMNPVPSIEPMSPNYELPLSESQLDVSPYGSEVIPGLKVFPSLIPAKVQEELIRRIVHRDLLDPKHMTNLHAHYDVEFPPPETASWDSIVATPKDPTVHPRALNYLEVMTKKLRWITLGGQYDWTNKVYPEEEPPKFPSDIANLVGGLFPDMEPQAAIVNFYSPKDTLQLHRDGAESVDRGLVSISLGCDCIFMIALGNPKSDKDHIAIRLRSGDVLYMQEESRFAWHGVPKIIPGTCPEYLAQLKLNINNSSQFMVDKRINLNVRQVRERKPAI
ncbi:hypothetical protein DSL72_007253 [Monilinia vaccinii-corymbosi]|uniref:Fe2OG dioxygenase domain-containing protein n=1 Tax=Monilinia vaccinii-corymbosi TaxID=61207 RepID=A0A8A3PLA9_9HELO|nr:hypothetical protein DSL72_007253 [Monilinia vaccinii-corymbosi]